MGQRSRPSRRQERSVGRRRHAADTRRRRVRSRVIWTAVGLLAVAVVIITVVSNRSGSANASPAIDGVQCNSNEQIAYHIHAHVAIFDQGQAVTIPQGTGIDQAHSCLYWLHTHDATNEIHIESPSQTNYTLGTFIDIWSRTLKPDYFLSHAIASGHGIRAFTGGTLFHGDPRDIPLTERKQITLEYGPPWVAPDTAFAFPSND